MASCLPLAWAMRKSEQPTGFERLIGRSLALGVHPYAAWRLSPASVRIALVAGYVAAGYLGGYVVILAML